jgi:hypothetical protein
MPAEARLAERDQEVTDLVEIVMFDRAEDQVLRFETVGIGTAQINTPCPT